MNNPKSLREWAYYYLTHHGFSVIPIERMGKKPLVEWKEYQERYLTVDELFSWFSQDDKNIAIITGKISGLIVIDIDGEEGKESLEKYNLNLPPTPCVKTGRGYHYYYQYVDGRKNKIKLYPGIDIKSDGGYVLAPPSIHPSGIQYEWVIPLDQEDLANPPDWIFDDEQESIKPGINLGDDTSSNLLSALDESILTRIASEHPSIWQTEGDKIIESIKTINGDRAWLNEILQGVPEGIRNTTAAQFAGYLLGKGYSIKDTAYALLSWNLKNRPPLPTKEIITTIKSIAKAEREERIKLLEEWEAEGINYSKIDLDSINAHISSEVWDVILFSQAFQDKVVWVPEWGSWAVYNGKVWERKSEELMPSLAWKLTKILKTLAYKTPDHQKKRKLEKHTKELETKARLNNIISLARSFMAVSSNAFDSNPDAICLENGILDLKTFELKPHDPKAYFTHMIPYPYNPNAECPRWLEFLKTVLIDDETIDYIQKVLGYIITGDTSEDAFFIIYGAGRNGKSTFINVIKSLLNDYTVSIPVDALLVKDQPSIPNDIARIRGARLIIASEAPEGKKLNTALIKQLTGRDTITARFLRQEYFDFIPQGKLCIVTNHQPEVPESTVAFWRRVKFIPFIYTIPEDKIIRNYEKILLEEAEGILKWIIDGCKRWQAEGLKTPEKIKQATEEYRINSDIVAEFIEEECALNSFYQISNTDLYNAFSEWCASKNYIPISQKRFTQKISDMGYRQVKSGKRFWQGITLKNKIGGNV